MTDPDRMVVWLREAMDAADRIARRHRHPCGEWEYDHMAGEIRDHCNAGTVAFVGKDDPAGEHMALHDPAAVLRRIAADRKILDDCERAFDWDNWGAASLVQDVIRNLAEGWGWTETRSTPDWPECMCTPFGECGRCWEKRQGAPNAHATKREPR
ncbi:DUF6221 family protein [Streptomyces mirabilis]|uniref:DUF6221 family protein n=1 Tax=Streptomyces mirabilis TaxID=68239 RepID=UPI00368AB174